MPSINQHISRIQSAPDRGTANRALSLTKRTIYGYMNAVRSFLITKMIEKGDSFPVALQQDLGCVPLECVDQADCDVCGWQWGDNVKKLVLPEIMEIDNNAGIMLFLIDKRTQIYLPSQIYGELDDFVRFPLKGTAGYQAQLIGNKTIYIKYNKSGNTPPLQVVNPRGIFKDPAAVDYYNGEKRCFDWDKDDYPIPGDLEDVMYTLIWQKYIGPFIQLPRDNTNQENNKAAA